MRGTHTTIAYSFGIGLIIVALAVGSISLLLEQKNGGDSSAGPAITTVDRGVYTDTAGNPVSLDVYRGDVLVLNAWASWCPFCIKELPDFGTLATEYKDREVTVIAINRAEPPGTARAFIDHVGNPEDLVFLLDPSDSFYASIGGFSMPETQVYNRAGELVAHRRGFLTIEQMRELVEDALNDTI